VINYVERPNWHEEVLRLTGGKGADCVVEIGGFGTLTNSFKALTVGGHISLIGSSLSRSGFMLDPLQSGGRGISLATISVGSRADFEAANRAVALHRLRPVIDRVFAFEDAPAAYRHFESRAHFGKVVVSHG
jgi:NADPH:quinone reductase-like Zn-dependent oxidoreductase